MLCMLHLLYGNFNNSAFHKQCIAEMSSTVYGSNLTSTAAVPYALTCMPICALPGLALQFKLAPAPTVQRHMCASQL